MNFVYVPVSASGGEEVSAFYLDPYARPAQKLGGAWMEAGRGTPVSFKCHIVAEETLESH